MASHIGHVDPAQPALISVTQGPLGMQLGDSIGPPAGKKGHVPSSIDMGNAGSDEVGDPNARDWATCSICKGIQDQETILTCQGCSVRTHVDCYFTAGSKDANDTITEAEEWRCETCGGLGRHFIRGQYRDNEEWLLGPKRFLRPGTGQLGQGALGEGG